MPSDSKAGNRIDGSASRSDQLRAPHTHTCIHTYSPHTHLNIYPPYTHIPTTHVPHTHTLTHHTHTYPPHTHSHTYTYQPHIHIATTHTHLHILTTHKHTYANIISQVVWLCLCALALVMYAPKAILLIYSHPKADEHYYLTFVFSPLYTSQTESLREDRNIRRAKGKQKIQPSFFFGVSETVPKSGVPYVILTQLPTHLHSEIKTSILYTY